MKKTLKLITLIFSTLMTVILLTVFGFTSVNAIKSSADESTTFDPSQYTYEELVQVDGEFSSDKASDVHILLDVFWKENESPKNVFIILNNEVAVSFIREEPKVSDSVFFTVYSVSSEEFSEIGSDAMYPNLTALGSKIYASLPFYDLLDYISSYVDLIDCESFSISYCDDKESLPESDYDYFEGLIVIDKTATFEAKENAENNQGAVVDGEETTNFFENLGEWFNGTFATEKAIIGLVVIIVLVVIAKKVLK